MLTFLSTCPRTGKRSALPQDRAESRRSGGCHGTRARTLRRGGCIQISVFPPGEPGYPRPEDARALDVRFPRVSCSCRPLRSSDSVQRCSVHHLPLRQFAHERYRTCVSAVSRCRRPCSKKVRRPGGADATILERDGCKFQNLCRFRKKVNGETTLLGELDYLLAPVTTTTSRPSLRGPSISSRIILSRNCTTGMA